jgi:signal transduction histidine kinase
MLGDFALTASFCLLQSTLLPHTAFTNGTSWVAGLVTVTLVGLSVAWPPSRAIPTGLLLIVAHLVGARHAGGGGWIAAGIQLLQLGALAALMPLLRRGARRADDVMVRLGQENSLLAALAAGRAEEVRQNDVLHGTVVATLTMVATGALQSSTQRLRDQARTATGELAELAAATRERRQDSLPATPVRLDERLRIVAHATDLDVDLQLVAVTTTAALAEAMVSATTEALANVVRHAQVDRATLRLTGSDADFTVEIVDRGVGFDPKAIPSHRYGVRNAIVDALARVGGEALLEARPGVGSRVLLRWPHAATADAVVSLPVASTAVAAAGRPR